MHDASAPLSKPYGGALIAGHGCTSAAVDSGYGGHVRTWTVTFWFQDGLLCQGEGLQAELILSWRWVGATSPPQHRRGGIRDAALGQPGCLDRQRAQVVCGKSQTAPALIVRCCCHRPHKVHFC